MKKRPITDSIRYRKFSRERDHALECVLHKYLTGIDIIVRKLERDVARIVAHSWAIHAGHATRLRAGFIDQELIAPFHLASTQAAEVFLRMRKSVYILSHASEAEAIGRALGTTQKAHVTGALLGIRQLQAAPSGGSVQARVDLAFSRLRAKVTDAIRLSLTLDEAARDALARANKAFPPTYRYKNPPRVFKNQQMAEALKLVKPADVDAPSESGAFSTGFLSEPEWKQAVTDYMAEELPGDLFRRGPTDKIVFFDLQDTGEVTLTERYEWELEQEITQDFIQQVRDGEIAAAKENGISDFVWVAITDSHTDECCNARDGLTVSEIESKLDSGDIDEDECEATVPPAHFNCRCKAAPMSDAMPDEPPFDAGSFHDWLEEKKAA